MAHQFLIVYPDTKGNMHDAVVLGAALNANFSRTQVTYLPLNSDLNHDYRRDLGKMCPHPKRGGYDAVFLIELARLNAPLLDPGFAKRVIYVPHIEWMNEADEASLSLGVVNTVLAKNQYTQTILQSIPEIASHISVPVTGWTSKDIGLGAQPWLPERFNKFLHVRGVSHLKQTDIVIEAWRKHPEWPRLLVTAYVRDPLSFEGPLSYGNNISVVLKKLSDEAVVNHARDHGVHILPSLAESFGHVLNEARSVGALLITSDAPPMNNLVDAGETGVLIDVDPASAVPHFRSQSFPVTVEALERAVEKVLQMPLLQRVEMGKAARRAYERDDAAFQAAIAKLEM